MQYKINSQSKVLESLKKRDPLEIFVYVKMILKYIFKIVWATFNWLKIYQRQTVLSNESSGSIKYRDLF
jgi:hypothetical protein